MKSLLIGAAIVFGVGQMAFASVPGLELISGANDSGVIPFTGGTASYSNANFGGWDIIVTLGVSFSPSLVPVGLDITNLDAECSAAGGCQNLNVLLSDVGFTQVVTGLKTFYSASDTGSSVNTSQSAWVDPGNVAFQETNLIGTVGPILGAGGSGSASLSISLGPSPYSLTLEDTFAGCTGPGCAIYSTDGNVTGVPEPVAVVLFGTVLAFCSTRLRRRKTI